MLLGKQGIFMHKYDLVYIQWQVHELLFEKGSALGKKNSSCALFKSIFDY